MANNIYPFFLYIYLCTIIFFLNTQIQTHVHTISPLSYLPCAMFDTDKVHNLFIFIYIYILYIKYTSDNPKENFKGDNFTLNPPSPILHTTPPSSSFTFKT